MSTDDTGTISQGGLFEKIGKAAIAAGREIILNVLTLWHTLVDEETSMWAKATIVGALAYFIMPLDLIPDFTPGIGYADDAAVLVAAMVKVADEITDVHLARAEALLNRWFS